MKARTTASILAALALALPAAASAQEEGAVVPPENSAATQYTEAVPTAGGDAQTGKGRKPAPSKVLGGKNAHKLESQGKDGRAVARVVAETAPETDSGLAPATSTAPSQPRRGGTPHEGTGTSGKSQGGGGGNGNAKAAKPQKHAPVALPARPTSADLPDGSSALGQVIGEATGSSSTGGIGLLLPLAILAAVAWSLAYLWQQRRPAE